MVVDIMVDLETMGTNPNAPIVAIGAVAFRQDGIVDTYYQTVSLESEIAAGACVDGATVMWWLKQSEGARAALEKGVVPAAEALTILANWMNMHDVAGVWGNGATFDNVILRQAFVRHKLKAPWPYWKDRCFRTWKETNPKVTLARIGVAHNALDDAIFQTEYMMAVHRGGGR